MMEIIKQNELYIIKDSLENGWIVCGTVNKDNNCIHIEINISENNNIFGNFNYYKPTSGNIGLHYDIDESLKDEFMAYTDTLVDFVLNYFNSGEL